MRARFAFPGRVSASSGRALMVAICALTAAFVSPVAHAHQASLTHATIEVQPDGQRVRYRLQMSPPDSAELLGLAPDTDPDADAVQSRQASLFQRLFQHIEVKSGDQLCPPQPEAAAITDLGERFLQAVWIAHCPTPITQLVVEYRLFFDIDPLSRSLVRVIHGDQEAFEELAPSRNRLIWDLDTRPSSRSQAWFVVSGVEHIIFGFDHVAFLLALLLIVVLGPTVSAPGFQVRPLRATLRDTALLVTSFTIAHSITLIAASLGWISLSARLVESVIAASIVYVALENLIRPQTRSRHLVTFAFGLIHGLGFASMLAVLLPPDAVVVPLLLFNLGVELGQLGIVALTVPALHLAIRGLGGARYRACLLTPGSLLFALLGLGWLLERAFELSIY